MERATGLETQISTEFSYAMTTGDVGWRGPSAGPLKNLAEGPMKKGVGPIEVVALVHELARAVELLRELKSLIDLVRSSLPRRTDGGSASPSPAPSATTVNPQRHVGLAIVADTASVVSGHDRLEIDPRAPDCSPIVRGTNLSVGEVVALLAEGRTSDQVRAIHPELTQDDIQACLNYIGADDELGPDPRDWPG